jgi:hypothetical protein
MGISAAAAVTIGLTFVLPALHRPGLQRHDEV